MKSFCGYFELNWIKMSLLFSLVCTQVHCWNKNMKQKKQQTKHFVCCARFLGFEITEMSGDALKLQKSIRKQQNKLK